MVARYDFHKVLMLGRSGEKTHGKAECLATHGVFDVFYQSMPTPGLMLR